MPRLAPDSLAAELKAGKFRPVYYLCGEEAWLKKRALDAIVNAIGPDAFNFSSYEPGNFDARSVVSEAITHPVMAERRVITVKSADKLKDKDAEALAEYFREPAPGTVMAVCSDAPPDPSDPLAAALSPNSALVDFEPMQEYQAERFVADLVKAAGRQADPDALRLVVDMAGTDSLALSNETEKLLLYRHGDKAPITPGDVMESAGYTRGLGPFEFTNALQAGDGPGAASLLERMFEEGVEPIRILAGITGLVAKLLRVKNALARGESGDAAAWSAGMSKGQFMALSRAAGGFAAERLSRALNLCLEADAMLKSSSGRNPRTLLKQLVYELTRK